MNGFVPRLLIETATVLSSQLSIISNKSLKVGIIPSELKKANVSPIFKNGSNCSAGSYRPVSLTLYECKVFESFLKDRINK